MLQVHKVNDTSGSSAASIHIQLQMPRVTPISTALKAAVSGQNEKGISLKGIAGNNELADSVRGRSLDRQAADTGATHESTRNR